MMESEPIGTTTIAPGVLNTIARLNALGTPGVSRMASGCASGARSAGKPDADGVKIVVKNGLIYADIFIIINSQENVRLVAEAVQKRVDRAISEIVGMEVASVNIHVTDIDIEA